MIDTQTDRQTDTHTHTHTDAGNDNTRRPKLASGKNDKLPVCVTNMFSTFSRAHAHDTRLDMILDESHSQTASGELCICQFLPKTVNNFDPDLKAMVVSHSYQSFTQMLRKR